MFLPHFVKLQTHSKKFHKLVYVKLVFEYVLFEKRNFILKKENMLSSGK